MPSSGTQSPDAYSALLTAKGFADMQENFLRLYDMFNATGYGNLAELTRAAFFRHRDELKTLAREIAAYAHEEIVDQEERTRVRPDTGGAGGPRMEDYIGRSYPLEDVPGSVGINFEPALAPVSWWWTNEEGYSGHVGRVVHGLFYEAGGQNGYTAASSPDASRFREHPIFRAEGPQRDTNEFGPDHDFQPPSKGSKGTRPGMVIRNPIPERRFVQHGYEKARDRWHQGFSASRAKFLSELDRIGTLMVRQPPRP